MLELQRYRCGLRALLFVATTGLLLGLFGCAGGSQPKSEVSEEEIPTTTSEAAQPRAPEAVESGADSRPFTAAQVRDAMPVGLFVRFRRTSGAETKIASYEVVARGDDWVELKSQVYGPQGEVVTTQTTRGSWDDFATSESFAEGMVVTQESVVTPAGEFDCMVYEAEQTQLSVTVRERVCFARQYPGLTVQTQVFTNGELRSQLEIIEFRPGGDGDSGSVAPPQ